MTLRTTDYSIFKKFPGNRPIDNTNLKKIKNSIGMHNMLEFRPLQVNERMEVIDGQHRLEVAKELRLEVYYTIQKNSAPIDVVLLNNAQKDWSVADYINFYAAQGKPAYIKLLEICKTMDVKVIEALYTLGYNGGKSIGKWKKGGVELLAPSDIEEVTNKLTKINTAIEFMEEKLIGDTKWVHGSFLKRAIIGLLNNASFEFDTFLLKLHTNLGKLHPCHSVNEFYAMFKAIYNTRNLNPLD